MTDIFAEHSPAGEHAIPSPRLTAEQDRFVLLHAHHLVVKWQWHFRETVLRAYSDRGNTATISRAGLDELIAAGVMRTGAGCADVALTDAGRVLLKGAST